MVRILTISLVCFTLFFTCTFPVFAVDSRVEATTTTPKLMSDFNFIKDIFVPDDNYFPTQISKLNDNVNRKLGGVAYLYHMIGYFFDTLNSPPAESDFTFSVPDNFFYEGFNGTSNNIFIYAKPFIRILKAVFTSFMVILTAISCYRKMVTFFEK